MEGAETGDDHVGHVRHCLRLVDTRITVIGGRGRGWTRKVELPAEWSSIRRVLGQQVVEDRGTRPRLAADDERPPDGAEGNLRVGCPPVDDSESIRQIGEQLGLHYGHPELVEIRRAIEILEKQVQAFLPGGFSQVTELSRLVRRLEELVTGKRNAGHSEFRPVRWRSPRCARWGIPDCRATGE